MAAHLSTDEVARIAELARLDVTTDEAAQFATQLTAILDYAAQVQQVPTDGVPPAAMAGDETVWRPDEPAASLEREAALTGAPDAAMAAGLFRVPKVL